jgi:hypothetical protein
MLERSAKNKTWECKCSHNDKVSTGHFPMWYDEPLFSGLKRSRLHAASDSEVFEWSLNYLVRRSYFEAGWSVSVLQLKRVLKSCKWSTTELESLPGLSNEGGQKARCPIKTVEGYTRCALKNGRTVALSLGPQCLAVEIKPR